MIGINTMRFLIFSLLLFWGQAAASNYQLGAGDQIQITVYGESDLTSQIKIDKSGVISFPFLSDIAVVGLTVKDLENMIANGLRGDYLIDPQVTVSIVMYRPFFIHGQVKRPGGYPLSGRFNIRQSHCHRWRVSCTRIKVIMEYYAVS